MRERRAGTIVNVSSIAGMVSRPYGGFYAASKHAVEAITEALHYEVAPFGIRVVLIEPGQYATRLLDNAFERRGASRRRRPTGSAPPASTSASSASCPAACAPTPTRWPADLRRRARGSAGAAALAGVDAQMIAGAYRQLEFEAFEQSMRQALDWWD